MGSGEVECSGVGSGGVVPWGAVSSVRETSFILSLCCRGMAHQQPTRTTLRLGTQPRKLPVHRPYLDLLVFLAKVHSFTPVIVIRLRTRLFHPMKSESKLFGLSSLPPRTRPTRTPTVYNHAYIVVNTLHRFLRPRRPFKHT